MPTRRRLWGWGVAALITMGCQPDLEPQEPRELETDLDAAISAAIDASTAPVAEAVPDARTTPLVVEKCRPAQAQPGPARATIMVEGVGSMASAPAPKQLSVEKLYESFDALCSSCHGNPSAKMGSLLVPSLDAFKTQVGADSLERLKSDDRGLVMPRDKKLLTERAAANPNDGVVLFAKRLEAWLAAGKPASIVDPIVDPTAATPEPTRAADGPPFAISKSLGSALSNMGTCIPAKELVGSAAAPMDSLDSLFAAMTTLEDLPATLSQTDLFTLDSEQLAKQGVLSFAPAYTLWADDSHKMRYVRVPRGQSIKFSVATQAFEIPDNTRFYKTFLKEVKDREGNIGYRKMETRIIVARAAVERSGSALPEIKALYGTYAWNEDESEATLVSEPYKDGARFADQILEYVTDEGHDAQLQEEISSGRSPYIDLFKEGSRRHYAIPGADRCVQCHLGQSSFVLGFLPLQIMRRPLGQGGVIEPAEPDELNQLERFLDYGLITGITKDEVARKILPLEKSEGARSPRNDYELVAQGYMLGNCAHCHNPKGYPSRTAPVLKDVLNFMPSAKGGGIFEFPLDKFSPRTRRNLPASHSGEDKELFDVPYITPSLFEMGTGQLSPYAWNQVCTDESNCQQPPTHGPWRSLIYRNVDNGFTYSDDSTIYPHMPMNTAGFDCRVPRIMADWMLSIPSVDVDADTKAIYPYSDLRPQPFVEVQRGHPRYDEALLRATLRLSVYHDDPRAKACKNSPDTIDKNAVSLDPKKWERSVLNPNNPDFDYRIPDRTHWVKLDNRALKGPWAPRNTQWEALFVQGDFSNYPDATEDAKDKAQSQEQLIPILKQMHLDPDFRKFALTDVPFGYWKEKPECNLSSARKRGAIEPNPEWSWLQGPTQQTQPADKPVYEQAPGAAIFGMICVNCHGAAFDANGRQATTVSDVTGGRVSVANFRDGMFGPVSAPGEGRRNVFSSFASGTDTVDDWSARYMAWMALGGTRAAIPPAVLRVVGDSPVLDKPVQRGVTASANMLEVAKVVCGTILPLAGDVAKYAGLRYAKENGDWDLWRRVCSFRNPAPLRVYYLTADELDLEKRKQARTNQPSPTFFRRNVAATLATATFYDAYDGVAKIGLGPDVRDPECVASSTPNDPKFEEAYRAAASDPKRRPLCPPELGRSGSLSAASLPISEQNLWTLRGAANAGFAVFSYIDAVTRGEVKPKPEYDQCEKLTQSAQP